LNPKDWLCWRALLATLLHSCGVGVLLCAPGVPHATMHTLQHIQHVSLSLYRFGNFELQELLISAEQQGS
jgi:hypothetical protein